MTTDAKKEAWKQHYERLLNVEFPWNAENLSFEAVSGPPIQVTHTMVEKAINKMNIGEASGPSGIVSEMFKASGPTGVDLLAKITISMIRNRDAS